MPDEHILFTARAWKAIVAMAEEDAVEDDDGATLAAAIRRHPVGCTCDNSGCRWMQALLN